MHLGTICRFFFHTFEHCSLECVEPFGIQNLLWNEVTSISSWLDFITVWRVNSYYIFNPYLSSWNNISVIGPLHHLLSKVKSVSSNSHNTSGKHTIPVIICLSFVNCLTNSHHYCDEGSRLGWKIAGFFETSKTIFYLILCYFLMISSIRFAFFSCCWALSWHFIKVSIITRRSPTRIAMILWKSGT